MEIHVVEFALSQDEQSALLEFCKRYEVWRGSIKNMLGSGGLTGFGSEKLEPSQVGMLRKQIHDNASAVSRADASTFVRYVAEILENTSGDIIPPDCKALPDYISEELAKVPLAARLGFFHRKTKPPSQAVFEAFLSNTDKIRRDVGQLHRTLTDPDPVDLLKTAQSPIATMLPVSTSQFEKSPDTAPSPAAVALIESPRTLPPSAAFIRDLAQMQFALAPGSNLVGPDERAYQVSIRVGELEDWIPKAGVDVTFSIRQFQVSVTCREAIPNLVYDLKGVQFYGKEGLREVKILHDYNPGSPFREKYFRFEPASGPDSLNGECDKDTLFLVKGPCAEGDIARLEIRSHQLKVKAKDADGNDIEIEELEARRIAENWLREQLFDGVARPLRYSLVDQALA
jgi:hypothetical protein